MVSNALPSPYAFKIKLFSSGVSEPTSTAGIRFFFRDVLCDQVLLAASVAMRRISALPAAATLAVCLIQARQLAVRKENFFSEEALPHARRVSWAPHTTPKKQGVFAKLSRSNFYDRKSRPFSAEPYCEEEIEAHRKFANQDIYIYRYNISPTHMALRP